MAYGGVMASAGGVLDTVVAHVHPILKAEGFKKRKHLFNRDTEGDLVHVIEVVCVESAQGDHVAVEVGVFSHRLHALAGGRPRVWVEAEHCQFRDPLALRDPDDPERRGYHPAFASRVLLDQIQSRIVPFLSKLTDMNDLVAVVPRRSIWGSEMDTEALIRLLAESGESLRAQALLQREHESSGPERRVALRALAASLPQLAFEAAHDVETEESFLAEWSESESERLQALRSLASAAPEAMPTGRFPEVLARTRYEVNPARMLDGSRESLNELWRWLMAVHGHLRSVVDDPQPLEARYRFPSVLTSAELWLAELLAVYLATILRNRNDDVRWELDDNEHLGLAGTTGFVDLLDRTCLAVLWVKHPPVEQAERLRIEELNQLDEILLFAEAELN